MQPVPVAQASRRLALRTARRRETAIELRTHDTSSNADLNRLRSPAGGDDVNQETFHVHQQLRREGDAVGR
jgi:hypothetical protein